MAAAAVIQRPFRGSRVSTFYPVKTLPPLSSLDSAFQLQEYISLLIRHNVHDVERIVALPGKPSNDDSEAAKDDDKEAEKSKSDIVVDEACWIYEQLRRLAQDLTHPLITMLQQECSRSSCSEMKAGEWLYLCVAHGTDGAMEQCCAIDYILHTLDSATALLNSPRAFPSRLQIPAASHRHFSSLARRLGRIFAHAYFHHRDIFAQAEAESSLYARFLALSSRYDLVPADFIVIPKGVTSDGEGDDGDIPRDAVGKTLIVISDVGDAEPPRLLAASIDPQGDRERDKLVQRPTSAPPINAASVRVISNRNNKTRNPPGLFVGGGSLIPASATATAAPTTAASLFESTETPVSQPLPLPPAASTMTGATPLAPGQESPRKTGRPRTDTMIHSEDSSSSGESGRGTSPIPVVRLGARLTEPEHPPDVATGRTEEPLQAADAEPKAVGTTEEPEPFVVPENLETEHAAETTDDNAAAVAAIGEEAKVEDADISAADFEPIDYEMVIVGQEPLAEEPATVDLLTNEKEEQDQKEMGEEPHHPETMTPELEEPVHVEELPIPAEEKSQVEKSESTTATSGEITEVPNGEHPAEAAVLGEGILDTAPSLSTPPEQESVLKAEAESAANPHEDIQGDSGTAFEEGEGLPLVDETAVVELPSMEEEKEEEVAREGSES